MSKSKIHSTAVIDSKATLGKNVSIGPYSVIGPDVTIGDDTSVENHVTIKGITTIGERNFIGPYTSIGLPAQDRSHRNEPTSVIIGDDNEIREYVSIHCGTLGGKGVTTIGNDNQLMVNTHFGHDVTVGNRCMVANLTTLAGHVEMGSFVVTGGMSGFHQFCRIGDYAMLGGYSVAYQDIAPYMLCTGSRARVIGLNTIGLERNGFSSKEIEIISQIHSIYFADGLIPQKAIQKLKEIIPEGEILNRFLKFVETTKRGLAGKN